MNVAWLLDGDMFESYRDELISEIRKQGHSVKAIHAPSPPFRWDDVGCSYRETFPKSTCVVSLGDIELVTRIHRERRWVPGAFCTIENFFWSSYACHYGRYLLNRDYVMLPFGELDRCKDQLFDRLGVDDRVFIRPDSPLKLFTGQTASRQSFAADLEFMGFYEFPVSSLVVVSSPKQIIAEWRFVVAHGEVVAGSQYKEHNTFEPRPGFSSDAFQLAQAIARLEYQPDPVWVLDVCLDSTYRYSLLEIGGFSFSDLYACDKSKIVEAVSAAAIDVWNKENW